MTISLNSFVKNISDQDLDSRLKLLVSKEREVLSHILIHIAEVDRRKLHLDLAYSSLFEYLTKHVGYSNGSAQRRIDAARLSREIPSVIEDLQSGKVNLMQISLLQKSVRQVQSESKIKVSTKTKANLVSGLADKSFSQSQILVSQTLDIKLKEPIKASHQKDESVRLEVTLSKEQWQKLIRMRELLSNSLPDGSWDRVLEFVSDKIIAQKQISLKRVNKGNMKNDIFGSKGDCDTDRNKNDVKNIANSNGSQVDGINIDVNSRSEREYISMAVKREVFNRDRSCQFHDKVSGQKCTSTWQLNLDHIKPVWAGGTNDVANLRVLCGSHNRVIYKQQTSTLSMN